MYILLISIYPLLIYTIQKYLALRVSRIGATLFINRQIYHTSVLIGLHRFVQQMPKNTKISISTIPTGYSLSLE